MLKQNYLIILILTTSLAACGGGSPTPITQDSSKTQTGTGAANTPTAAPEKINGIIVPSDPGSQKNSTVAGVDLDHNGIRDEIDRWIATKYGDKPGAIAALQMGVRVSQKLLTINPTNKESALAVIYENMDTGGCIGEKLRSERVNTDDYFDESYLRTYNTRSRIDEYKRVSELAGPIARDVSESIIKCPY